MKIRVQWAKSEPGDWTEIGASEWKDTRRKPDPTGKTPIIDNGEGFCNRINVQGIEFTGDHYHVEPDGDDCVVTVWSDDPAYYSGGRNAAVWRISRLSHDGRRWNTVQTCTRYAEGDAYDRLLLSVSRGMHTSGGPVVVRPYREFRPPKASECRHGVMLAESAYQDHLRLAHHPGWREWTDGVPIEKIRSFTQIWCQVCGRRWESGDPEAGTHCPGGCETQTRTVSEVR